MTKTRSLALVAAVLMAGCSTTNYYADQPVAYNSGGYADAAPVDQYAGQYDQYNDQPNVNVDVGVSFGGFQRELAPYGNWTNHPRWGDVWRPRAAGFRPYFDGYWANTREYGVIWVSNDPWGDVTTHYGRWVFDPRDGWMWVPGYVWGPSWVVWRSGGGSIGWLPMPPDDYYGEGPYRGRHDNFYGYRDWYGPSFSNDTFVSLWIFVGEDRFSDRNYRNYVRPQREYNTLIVNTTEVTNYVTVNNYIVNRSVNIERVERASNRRFEAVEARSVMKRDAKVTPVAAGRQIEQRERRERPIPANANVNAGGGRDNNDGRGNAVRAREDVRDARQDARDARQDVREDNGPNGRGRQNDQVDRNPRGVQPQNAQGPQGGGNQADRAERREERIDNRERVQAPQNANVPQQNGNAERNARNPRENVRDERAAGRPERVERAVERGGNDQNAVQPAGARRNEAAPVQVGGTDTEESREAERKARRDEAAARAAERRNR